MRSGSVPSPSPGRVPLPPSLHRPKGEQGRGRARWRRGRYDVRRGSRAGSRSGLGMGLGLRRILITILIIKNDERMR